MVFPFARFEISGHSMEPRFRRGDRVFVLRRGEPKTGDVVVFSHPRGGERAFLKRVAAVTENGYLLFGDNEGDSSDSRKFGPVAREQIIGKVLFRY